MRRSLLSLSIFVLSIACYGCGAAEPGSTVKDERAGGEPSTPIIDAEDPQMGDDYMKKNK